MTVRCGGAMLLGDRIRQRRSSVPMSKRKRLTGRERRELRRRARQGPHLPKLPRRRPLVAGGGFAGGAATSVGLGRGRRGGGAVRCPPPAAIPWIQGPARGRPPPPARPSWCTTPAG